MRGRRRASAGALVVVLTTATVGWAVAPAGAQEPGADRVVDIVRRSTDLLRRVESISGDVRTFESPDKVQVSLAADVLFEFDKADLTPAAAAQIDEAAGRVKTGSKGPVAIVGHTDAKGTDAYNQDLSLRRANAVRDALAVKAPGITYEVSGKGASEPIAPNTNEDGSDNPEGRARNRRVTVTFSKA